MRKSFASSSRCPNTLQSVGFSAFLPLLRSGLSGKYV
jgi:hypothetical protein